MIERIDAEAHGRPATAAGLSLAFLALCTLGAAVWSVGRGVSFVDEGFFLGEVLHPGPAVTLWGHLVNALFGWTGLGLRASIWINLLAGGAAAVWFACQVTRWVHAEGWVRDTRPWARHAVGLLVVGGSFLRLATVPMATSYNTINQILVLIALGLLLGARTAFVEGDDVRPWRSLLLGLVVGVIVFVRATTALALAPTLGVVWCLAATNTVKDALRSVAFAVGGGVAAIGLAFLFVVSPGEWFEIVTELAATLAKVDPGHSVSDALARAPVDVANALVTTLIHYRWALGPGVVCLVVLRFSGEARRESITRLVPPGAIGVAALFAATIVHMGQYGAPLRGVVQPYLAFLILAGLTVGPGAVVGAFRARSALIVATLLVAPLFGILGSNRHWMMYWPVYATPWFAVLGVAALCSARAVGLRRGGYVALVGLGVLATCQTWIGMLATPMGLAPRWQQTEVLDGFGKLDGVRVDAETLAYLTRIRDLAGPASGSGQGSIGLYSVHAEQIALSTRPLGSWWTLHYLSDAGAIAEAMSSIPRDELRSAMLILHARGDAEAPERTLRGLGLPFPDGYEYRGSATHPHTNKLVRVYLPHRRDE